MYGKNIELLVKLSFLERYKIGSFMVSVSIIQSAFLNISFSLADLKQMASYYFSIKTLAYSESTLNYNQRSASLVSHLQVLCTMEELTVHHVLAFQRMNAKSISLADLLLEKMRKFFFFFLGEQRHFLTKVHLVKAMVFPVVMYICEN